MAERPAPPREKRPNVHDRTLAGLYKLSRQQPSDKLCDAACTRLEADGWYPDDPPPVLMFLRQCSDDEVLSLLTAARVLLRYQRAVRASALWLIVAGASAPRNTGRSTRATTALVKALHTEVRRRLENAQATVKKLKALI